MIPETLTWKFLGLLAGVLSGLTVLVRLGRLLEQVEALRTEVAALRLETSVQGRQIARLQGRVD
jgi:hypothetical protein